MDIIKKKFAERVNATGKLTFLESMRDIPFEVRRVYYIYDVVEGERRGFHAHKNLEQYLICVKGKCTILLDDGKEKRDVILDNPNEGLYVRTNVWHEMYDFSKDAVLLVLASDYYDENDYIRSYEDFLSYIAGNIEVKRD